MKRRSKVSGGRANSRPPKAAKAKRRNTPKAALRSQSTRSGDRAEVARLTRERDEARQQLSATANILRVISQSPTDVRALIDSIVLTAARSLRSDLVIVFLCDGPSFSPVAGASPEGLLTDLGPAILPIDGSVNFPSRAILDKKMLYLPDWSLTDLPEHELKIHKLLGVNSSLYLPLLRHGECIGLLNPIGKRPNFFGAIEIAQAEFFRDQALIAINNARLLNELRERTEDVEKLNKHLEQRVTDQVGEIERIGRLRRFLPPQVADLIVASGSEKQLESHRREITALFCDLRGFTGFTETADAEDVIALLREYHAAIGEKIIKYSGTLERYAGDGVMVVFNDPVPVENPALQAVLMALENARRHRSLDRSVASVGARDRLRHRYRARLRYAGYNRLRRALRLRRDRDCL
jgi:class 3 adenylate cyclase